MRHFLIWNAPNLMFSFLLPRSTYSAWASICRAACAPCLADRKGLGALTEAEVLVALIWSAMQISTSTPGGPHSTAVLVASLGMHHFPHRKRWPRTGSEMLDVHWNKSLSLWTWMSQSAVVHYHLSHYFANIWTSARIHQHISGFQECQEFIPAVH